MENRGRVSYGGWSGSSCESAHASAAGDSGSVSSLRAYGLSEDVLDDMKAG